MIEHRLAPQDPLSLNESAWEQEAAGPLAAGQARASRQGLGSGGIGHGRSPRRPSWTVTSVLEQSYTLARDNFAAFFTVAVIFGAVSLVVNILSLGLLAGLVGLVCGVATLDLPHLGTRCKRPRRTQARMGADAAPAYKARRFRLDAAGGRHPVFRHRGIDDRRGRAAVPDPLWAVDDPRHDGRAHRRGRRLQSQHGPDGGEAPPDLGAFLLWFVIFGLGAIVLIALLGHGALGSLVMWIYGALAGIVLHTLPAIFYVLLREEKEGVTAGQIAAHCDDGRCDGPRSALLASIWRNSTWVRRPMTGTSPRLAHSVSALDR